MWLRCEAPATYKCRADCNFHLCDPCLTRSHQDQAHFFARVACKVVGTKPAVREVPLEEFTMNETCKLCRVVYDDFAALHAIKAVFFPGISYCDTETMSAERVAETALLQLRTPVPCYDLLNNNCESFARRIKTGDLPPSAQIESWGMLPASAMRTTLTSAIELGLRPVITQALRAGIRVGVEGALEAGAMAVAKSGVAAKLAKAVGGAAAAGGIAIGAIELLLLGKRALQWNYGQITEEEFWHDTRQSLVKAGFTFAGSLLGSLIPVPFLGSFLGGICGSLVGSIMCN